MRCINCGWENDYGAHKCEKCNAPLDGSPVDGNRSFRSRGVDSSEEELKKTVRDVTVFEEGVVKCPNCGYLYNPEMGRCPNCGEEGGENKGKNKERGKAALVECPYCHEKISSKFAYCPVCGKPLKPVGGGTINPWVNPQNGTSCTLTPIAWEGEESTPKAKKYTGETIELNRENTDPDNNSITSKVQAVLTHSGGSWYIEDKSQEQTTYLHVSHKMKLEDGAIVILGNRRFIFKK